LSRNLSYASKILFEAITNKKITQIEHDKASAILLLLNEPVIDTELVIVESLKNLLNFCKTNYLMQ
ncbi:hypothetical protein, partial [Winogradskyella sp.]|uniref:hypothetical protein n=1 Tax=Winogradskyella sp. TaxID=1883156 RepID=UPI0025F4146F